MEFQLELNFGYIIRMSTMQLFFFAQNLVRVLAKSFLLSSQNYYGLVVLKVSTITTRAVGYTIQLSNWRGSWIDQYLRRWTADQLSMSTVGVLEEESLQVLPCCKSCEEMALCTATSTPSERVFPICGMVNSAKQSSMSGKSIQSQVFVHNNINKAFSDWTCRQAVGNSSVAVG